MAKLPRSRLAALAITPIALLVGVVCPACNAEPAAVQTPEPQPNDPPDPPRAAGLTPGNLVLLLGPTVSRSTQTPDWPSGFEQRLDAAISRMVQEVVIGSYNYVTDVADQDNPHYGPLRMVTMRNIRAGLSLDEREPAFAAALKITREFIRLYAKPHDYRVLVARNTNWADCEIIWWLFHADKGDNGTLAQECRAYLQNAANWMGWQLNPSPYGSKENLAHEWMDTRTLAMVIETALTADRLGIPFGKATPNGTAAFVPPGVKSWREWIGWVNGFIDRVQQKTMEEMGSMTDPNGLPILFGNIRYQAPSSSPTVRAAKPYPVMFFMDAMLANALLRAWRQYGDTASRDNAIELAIAVKQHYDPVRKCLPYASHRAPGAFRFKGTNEDYDLNNFWVRPLLEMYHLTGEAWMREAAVGLITASVNGAWLWRFKQAQQLGSATEPQSAQAWLAGVH